MEAVGMGGVCFQLFVCDGFCTVMLGDISAVQKRHQERSICACSCRREGMVGRSSARCDMPRRPQQAVQNSAGLRYLTERLSVHSSLSF